MTPVLTSNTHMQTDTHTHTQHMSYMNISWTHMSKTYFPNGNVNPPIPGKRHSNMVKNIFQYKVAALCLYASLRQCMCNVQLMCASPDLYKNFNDQYRAMSWWQITTLRYTVYSVYTLPFERLQEDVNATIPTETTTETNNGYNQNSNINCWDTWLPVECEPLWGLLWGCFVIDDQWVNVINRKCNFY